MALLAGLPPVGVTREILDADGTMARRPKLEEFGRARTQFITVAQLVRYRLTRTRLVERSPSRMPTAYGDFDIIGYSTDGRTRAYRPGEG